MLNFISINMNKFYKNIRIDIFLYKKMKIFSTRSQCQKFINNRGIYIRNKYIKNKYINSSYKICGYEVFLIKIKKINYIYTNNYAIPQNININIIYEDKDIVVVNKNTNIVTHPGVGNKYNTLANAISYKFSNNILNNDKYRCGIVHRLDKETTGLIICAKNLLSLIKLKDDFKFRRIYKYYRAFCWGKIEKTYFNLITPHTRHPKNRKKFTGINNNNNFKLYNKVASSFYYKINNYKNFITQLYVQPITGRTHQIRVQLFDIGYPIIGDKIYYNKELLFKINKEIYDIIISLNQHALHAEFISFIHPTTRKRMVLKASLPKKLIILNKMMNKLSLK